MSKTRAERAAALEAWAERVDADESKVAGTEALRVIAELVERHNEVDEELTAAVRAARRARRSWSEIGAMLGVSKQAAQRTYSAETSA